MKRYFAAIIFLIGFSLQASCHVSSDSLNNQFGINIYGFIYPPHSQYLNRTYNHVLFNGLYYKRKLNRKWLRFGVDYIRIKNELPDISVCADCPLYDGTYDAVNFWAGLEHRFFSGPAQVYVGGEVFAGYVVQDVVRRGGIAGTESHFTDRSGSFGFGPFIGINYRPLTQFSLTYELSIMASYPDKELYNAFDLLINPVRMIGVNWHF